MQHIRNQYLITWTPKCDIPGTLENQSVRITMYALMNYEFIVKEQVCSSDGL